MTNVSFPQLIQRGCGIDVHLKVVATIDGVRILKETRSFNTFTSCLTEMKEWLLAKGITHVAMESTSVYWKPVMRVLEEDIPNVWIVNARHIKGILAKYGNVLELLKGDTCFQHQGSRRPCFRDWP